MAKVVLPSPSVFIQVPSGIEPIWYEKLQALTDRVNVLDAFVTNGGYSEATYTPVLSASGGTIPTFTATPLTGGYFKIGRLVTVRITASNTVGGTLGAGAQQLSVSLPLPIAANALSSRVPAGSYRNGTEAGLSLAEGVAGSSTALLFQQSVSGAKVVQTPLTNADFNNVTRTIAFSITYPTD